jgi:hypothetical protein
MRNIHCESRLPNHSQEVYQLQGVAAFRASPALHLTQQIRDRDRTSGEDTSNFRAEYDLGIRKAEKMSS